MISRATLDVATTSKSTTTPFSVRVAALSGTTSIRSDPTTRTVIAQSGCTRRQIRCTTYSTTVRIPPTTRTVVALACSTWFFVWNPTRSTTVRIPIAIMTVVFLTSITRFQVRITHPGVCVGVPHAIFAVVRLVLSTRCQVWISSGQGVIVPDAAVVAIVLGGRWTRSATRLMRSICTTVIGDDWPIPSCCYILLESRVTRIRQVDAQHRQELFLQVSPRGRQVD